MPLTRRELHKGFAALALSLAAGPGLAAPALRPAPRPRLGAADPDAVFLNRLTFGATPAALAELSHKGRAAWLAGQLAPDGPDHGLERRLSDVALWIEYEAGKTAEGKRWKAVAEHRALDCLDAPEDELILRADLTQPMGWAERERPAREVQAAALVRAVHGRDQLGELMTQFWHDHFNVNAFKNELTAAMFPAFDRGLRTHALGNFRALLGHVAASPSMLNYLNNDNSRASPANENFARELLELHTLGQAHYMNAVAETWRDVPGAQGGMAEGYIDDDVYEAARAFTGWSVGDGRWIAENQATPVSGQLAYVEAWHDPYQKRILGVEFPSHAAPMADGEKLLDLLAAHPATARHVSGKILRRLGIEAPSEGYAREIAACFRAARNAPDQIAQVVRAVVEHPEFDATLPAKLRRPFEFLAALYRATGAELRPSRGDIAWLLSRAGWQQHAYGPPTGHSDATGDWADTRTIAGTVALALEAHGAWVNIAGGTLRRRPGVATMGGLATYWQDRFGLARGALAEVPASLGHAFDDPLPEDDDGFEWVNSLIVASAALDRQFLYR